MLDATVAIHSARKIGSVKGLHGETISSFTFEDSFVSPSSLCAERLIGAFLLMISPPTLICQTFARFKPGFRCHISVAER
jgi:hypothetical protein